MSDPTQHARLLDQIAEHDKDLAQLRVDISGVQTAVKHVADGQKLLASTLDEIRNALGARGKASVQEVAAYLQVVALLFAIAGGTVSGIVYIASNAQASKVELLQYRIDRMYGSFGWEPTVKRTGPQ